jgi:hypothetical protein
MRENSKSEINLFTSKIQIISTLSAIWRGKKSNPSPIYTYIDVAAYPAVTTG